MAGLKNFKRLPVYIVEDHNDVLPLIYRNIGAKYLPFEGNLMVHFDSHPDLLVDKDLPETVCWKKEELFDNLSIENWILPGCYTGQFSKVLWIKPSWTQQFPVGFHDIVVGEFDGKLRVGSPLYYYISDGIFIDKDLLKNRKEFRLGVFEWPVTEKIVNETKFILDIDLDFFSTQNPFLALFDNGGLLTHIQQIFTLVYETTTERSYREFVDLGNQRVDQLNVLEMLFTYLEKNGNLDDFEKDIPDELQKQMENIISIVDKHYDLPNFNWKLLYSAGMTCDMYPLPHYVTTKSEINASLTHFQTFLHQLPAPPVMVTIARSSDDDYCPKNQVEFIQKSVLKILHDVFGETNVYIHYVKEIGCSLPDELEF